CGNVQRDCPEASQTHGCSSLVVHAVGVPRSRQPTHKSNASARTVTRAGRALNYFAAGRPNRAASIATLVLISFNFAVYLPSSQVNLYSNGNLMPPTSR